MTSPECPCRQRRGDEHRDDSSHDGQARNRLEPPVGDAPRECVTDGGLDGPATAPGPSATSNGRLGGAVVGVVVVVGLGVTRGEGGAETGRATGAVDGLAVVGVVPARA